ncbi:hypothetical protein AVEN_102909-1 [Araneus ventricosus]|uniref:Uncharacterized protein n=1 Tax=Araneus ventricosus TaxID=182803 RepID=A0A4Y2I0H5_ARAVE|nr:hypothetical protein AVEN_102909-1 [Araneus ventricosus]
MDQNRRSLCCKIQEPRLLNIFFAALPSPPPPQSKMEQNFFLRDPKYETNTHANESEPPKKKESKTKTKQKNDDHLHLSPQNTKKEEDASECRSHSLSRIFSPLSLILYHSLNKRSEKKKYSRERIERKWEQRFGIGIGVICDPWKMGDP